MIYFKKIRIANFASIGNRPIEIDYTSFNIGLVSGPNGAGKSQSFLYSLYYALYGKSFSKTTLGALVNNINKKGLLVELDFSIGANEYRIRRGIKPAVFEIYINGTLKPQPSTTKEYQDYLVKNILKMDERTFRQLVVVGSSTYVPFMRLPAGERRVVVEDMLNLGIFTRMLEASKLELQEVQSTIRTLETDILESRHSLDVLLAKKKERESITGTILQELKDQISQAQDSISTLQEKFSSISLKKEEYDSAMGEVSRLKGIIEEARGLRVKITTLKSQSLKRQSFFEEHSKCPTCEREIGEELKEKVQGETKSKVEEYDTTLQTFDTKLESLSTRLSSAQDNLDNILKAIKEKTSISEEITKVESRKKELESKLESTEEKLKESVGEDREKIGELKESIEKLTESKESWAQKQTAILALQSLLKDDGVKSSIIKSYIPLLNQYIRKYLDIMNSSISFEFDENFEAKIEDAHSPDLEYGSRSMGESLRLDYAILFSLRDLVKIRSSISTNLLVLDEADGGCLDAAGFQAFTGIISALEDTNVLIISHSEEEYTSLADTTFNIEKVGGFTKIRVQ